MIINLFFKKKRREEEKIYIEVENKCREGKYIHKLMSSSNIHSERTHMQRTL